MPILDRTLRSHKVSEWVGEWMSISKTLLQRYSKIRERMDFETLLKSSELRGTYFFSRVLILSFL